jgi:hypothetical protein
LEYPQNIFINQLDTKFSLGDSVSAGLPVLTSGIAVSLPAQFPGRGGDSTQGIFSYAS